MPVRLVRDRLVPDRPVPSRIARPAWADQVDENYDTTVDVLWQSCVAEMDRWHKPGEFPYDKTLLLEHMKTWNMKLLSRETGIPYRSICYSVEKIKERLKRAIELNL